VCRVVGPVWRRGRRRDDSRRAVTGEGPIVDAHQPEQDDCEQPDEREPSPSAFACHGSVLVPHRSMPG
jgi:hypothetical protein